MPKQTKMDLNQQNIDMDVIIDHPSRTDSTLSIPSPQGKEILAQIGNLSVQVAEGNINVIAAIHEEGRETRQSLAGLNEVLLRILNALEELRIAAHN